MDKEINYITEDKKKALELELEDLRGPKRKDVIAAIEYAKSLGDLSENAEYHQAREEQAGLEDRIKKIEEILRSSKVVVHKTGDVASIGSKVIVQKEGTDEEKTFQIVGGEEADMSQGKISNRSPFGEALLGKKKGDKVSFTTPGGVVNYKIINVA